jgi:hypothetical protein
MFFDAFGRFSFGQISQAATSTAVLVGGAGAYTITGGIVAFRSAQPAPGGGYAITGNATGGTSSLLASAGGYAINGGAALFADTMAAAAGGYAITGQATAGRSGFVAAAGAYAITGAASVLTPALLTVSGSYAITGGSSWLPGSMRAEGGAYALTPGQYTLARTGGDFEQVYGGIGHYLEEIERLRQLAKITRKTPAPIVQEIGPPLRPMPAAPATLQPPAIDLQAVMAQRVALEQAEQAKVLKRRRQEAEILLLAS